VEWKKQKAESLIAIMSHYFQENFIAARSAWSKRIDPQALSIFNAKKVLSPLMTKTISAL
jgi:hypothetical protein